MVLDYPQAAIARITPNGPEGPHWLLLDALYMPGFDKALVDAVGARRRFNGRSAFVSAHPTQAFRGLTRGVSLDPRPRKSEQSNTSVSFGDRLILKVFRRLEPGINPDLEIGQALTGTGFAHVPAVAGWLAYRPAAESAALGILQQFVENQGDAWEYTLDQVGTFYERAATFENQPPPSAGDPASIIAASLSPTSPGAETIGSADGSYLNTARLLGQRTGELHRALAGVDDPAFVPEAFTALNQRSLYQTMRTQAGDALATLDKKLGELPDGVQDDARAALARGSDIQERLRAVMGRRIEAMRIRCHGDLHLGQVLWTGRDFVFIDFEGEPGRPMAERRHKRSAMTDVAGMLRSYHYAALGTLVSDRVGGAIRPEDVARLTPWADLWYRTVAATFLGGYREAAVGADFMPPSEDELALLLSTSMLHKVMYELSYELNNRPDWVAVPLRGLLDLLGPADQA